MTSLTKASNLSWPSLLIVAPSNHTREKMKVDWGREGGRRKKVRWMEEGGGREGERRVGGKEGRGGKGQGEG